MVDTHFEIRRFKLGLKRIAAEVESLDAFIQDLVTDLAHKDKETRDADFKFIKNSLA